MADGLTHIALSVLVPVGAKKPSTNSYQDYEFLTVRIFLNVIIIVLKTLSPVVSR